MDNWSKYSKPVFMCNDIYRRSTFNKNHPLSVPRVPATVDLIKELGWLPENVYYESSVASIEDLLRFHDADYIAALRQGERGQSLSKEIRTLYNLGKIESPIHANMFTRPAVSAGAMIAAADFLSSFITDDRRIVIYSPASGSHHGRKNRASGFCYLNDLVLAILRLLDNGISNIYYIDLDAHHGDGVQDAFHDEERVFTLSIHEEGRWPFTGALEDRAGGCALNLPVPSSFNDNEMDLLVDEVVIPIGQKLKPEIIIIQCGADSLADDPLSKLKLTNYSLWRAVRLSSSLSNKVLVTGGGGYNPWGVARCWAGVWATLNNYDIPKKLPLAAEMVLRKLEWSRSAGQNPPEHWFTTLSDTKQSLPIRDEIRNIIDTVNEKC
jgi:acetoin utilization protein AcuC